MSPDQNDDLVGRTLLGRYRVVMPLGRGGMGRVYLARTQGAAGFAKPAVVKRILPELVTSRTTVDLFVREAKILSNLHHPGVINVVDFGEEDGAYVMVLEYVHGYDLAAWKLYSKETAAQVPAEFDLYVMIRVLETLHYAHEYRRPDGKPLQIVHRDVSPGNVLLSVDGQIKLGDFGIARISDEASDVRTQFGTFRGKIGYAAPELLEGDEATAQADVYSAGVVLLELLSGNNPYSAPTVTESMHRVLTMPPPKLAGVRPDLSADIDAVLARALAKTREDRYLTTQCFAQALRELLPRPEDRIASALTERIRKDFAGNMPEIVGLDPLVLRDQAWRSAPPGATALDSTPPRSSLVSRESSRELSAPDQATMVEAFVPELASAENGRGRLASTARSGAAGLLILASALVVGWTVWRARERTGPEYVVIERQSSPDSLGSPSAARRTVESPPGDAVPAGTGSSQAQVAFLSRAVQRQQSRIQSCFETHVAQVGGNPQVTLRFELDPTGKVVEASVEPTALSKSPLGACLLQVALSTDFPAPGQAVGFRVPITARMAPR
jgi:serine/threonine-protein kinase